MKTIFPRNKKFFSGKKKKIIILSVFLVIIYLVFFSEPNRFLLLRNFGVTISKPFFQTGNFLSGATSSFGSYFRSKSFLEKEFAKKNLQITVLESKLLDYEKISKQREELLGIFGRLETPANYILAGVLSAPPRSPYDTLILDVGGDNNIQKGMAVYSNENSIIGKIEDVFPSASIVKLLSFPGELFDVHFLTSNIVATAIGLGGGNFSVEVPSSSKIEKGELVETAGVESSVIGRVGKVEIDSANPFHTIRFRIPENIQDLRFVLVRKK